MKSDMRKQPITTPVSSHTIINDCWNKIGVRGDSSCPELKKYVHCRNCPVHSAAAVNLLDTDLPADYLTRWTSHVAQVKTLTEIDTHSVVIFRIADEWLALPTILFKEIAGIGAIHSVPHRQNGVMLGLTNIRGELLVCVSLQELLGLQQSSKYKHDKQHSETGRFMEFAVFTRANRCQYLQRSPKPLPLTHRPYCLGRKSRLDYLMTSCCFIPLTGALHE
jgi:chemotaxis-related protein WspD